VRKALQKQGVGGLLFTGCKEWAKAGGASSIELNVWAFNANANANAFYEHLGMKGISRKMSMNIWSYGKKDKTRCSTVNLVFIVHCIASSVPVAYF